MSFELCLFQAIDMQIIIRRQRQQCNCRKSQLYRSLRCCRCFGCCRCCCVRDYAATCDQLQLVVVAELSACLAAAQNKHKKNCIIIIISERRRRRSCQRRQQQQRQHKKLYSGSNH